VIYEKRLIHEFARGCHAHGAWNAIADKRYLLALDFEGNGSSE
jgi:hypothetical protein